MGGSLQERYAEIALAPALSRKRGRGRRPRKRHHLRTTRTRMQHRPISRPQRAQRRRRRQQHRIAECGLCLLIASHRPLQRPALHDQETLLAHLHHRAVGQLLHRHRQRMQPLLAALQPLAMKHGVDLARAECFSHHCPLPTAARNRLASSRRQKKQGRWPAANAVASSRKNSSVQLRPPITLRRHPRNSQTQVIQAGLDQRFFSKVLVAGSWMMPRLPVNRPRCAVAMMSPVGVTRF